MDKRGNPFRRGGTFVSSSNIRQISRLLRGLSSNYRIVLGVSHKVMEFYGVEGMPVEGVVANGSGHLGKHKWTAL